MKVNTAQLQWSVFEETCYFEYLKLFLPDSFSLFPNIPDGNFGNPVCENLIVGRRA